MSELWTRTLSIYAIAIAVSLLIGVVIRVIVAALGRLEARQSTKPVPVPAPVAGGDEDPPAEHVAAIAAAIHAMLGAHRIVHIEESRRRAGWLAEGRLAQHASHGPEHHPRH